MAHVPASIPFDEPKKTTQSERKAPVSVPMKKAFLQLERIKKQGDRELAFFYASSSAALTKAINWNPEKGVTKATVKAIDIWSVEAAKTRNEIIIGNINKAIKVANEYLAAEMRLAWGVVDPSATTDVEAKILKIIQRNLAIAAGEATQSALSKNWWKNGFSNELSRQRLLNSLKLNAVLFRDAVKAGTDLVKTGQIRITEKAPKYIQRLIELAKTARRNGFSDFNKELNKALKRINALRGQIVSTPTGQQVELVTRAGKKKIVSAIRQFAKTGSQAALDTALKKYSLKQALFNARTLQRSVVNDAFQTRVSDWAEENEDLVDFVIWQLAPVRNFKDICDDYARKKWKAKEVPAYPHYNCACTTQVILIPAKEFFDKLAA